jgi:hypothetical protein
MTTTQSEHVGEGHQMATIRPVRRNSRSNMALAQGRLDASYGCKLTPVNR